MDGWFGIAENGLRYLVREEGEGSPLGTQHTNSLVLVGEVAGGPSLSVQQPPTHQRFHCHSLESPYVHSPPPHIASLCIIFKYLCLSYSPLSLYMYTIYRPRNPSLTPAPPSCRVSLISTARLTIFFNNKA